MQLNNRKTCKKNLFVKSISALIMLIKKKTKMSNRHVVQAGKVQSSTVPNNKIRKYYFVS